MVCENHGIFDVFPCPWPGCENGCLEDKFELICQYSEKTKHILGEIGNHLRVKNTIPGMGINSQIGLALTK